MRVAIVKNTQNRRFDITGRPGKLLSDDGAAMSREKETEVLTAAAELVARFGAHDVAGYFAAFAADASFIFHSTPEILYSRLAYETLWKNWESQDGFRVLGCRSIEPHVAVHGDTAVFTHRVETRLSFGAEETTANERETIIFRRQPQGNWLAIHEHLSPLAVNHLTEQ